MKGALATVEICVPVVDDSQISLTCYRRHLIAAIQLTVSCSELYFARCCALAETNWNIRVGKRVDFN